MATVATPTHRTSHPATRTTPFMLTDSQINMVTQGLELLAASLRVHSDMLLEHQNPVLSQAFRNRARRAESLGFAMELHENPKD